MFGLSLLRLKILNFDFLLCLKMNKVHFEKKHQPENKLEKDDLLVTIIWSLLNHRLKSQLLPVIPLIITLFNISSFL